MAKHDKNDIYENVQYIYTVLKSDKIYEHHISKPQSRREKYEKISYW